MAKGGCGRLERGAKVLSPLTSNNHSVFDLNPLPGVISTS